MIRALIGIGLLQFASMLLLLVRTKILATTVGLTGVGTISAVDSLTAVVAQTLSLSMPFATLRFLPAALRVSPEETDLLYRRMRAVMVALLVPATVVCVGIAIVAPERWGAALVPYQRTLILAFASLPVVGLIPFFTNVYAGAIGHRQAMTLTIAHAGVMVVAAAVAGAGLGVAGFYGAYALLGTVLIVVAARRLRIPGLAMAERRRLSLRDAFRLPPVVWRFAAWLLPLMFAASYTAYFVRYSTLRLFGANATGILQGAIGISLSVKALLGTAHGIFLTPHVNRQADPAARMAWANEFQRTTGLLFVVTLPPLLLFSDIALRLLYSAPFRAGSPFVALFVAAEVLTMLSGTYQSLIIAGDRMRFHVLQNLAAQALLAGTAAVALPRLGLAGAGIAVLTAPVFMFVSTLVFLDRVWGVHVSRGAVRMSLVAIAILVVAGGIGSRYPGLGAGLLGAKAALCAAIWLCAYAAISGDDRLLVRDGAARLIKRVASRFTPTDEVA